MATTTTEYLLDSTTTEQPELTTLHNQIGFEIPSDHDLQHIDVLHRFNTLLQRIAGTSTAAVSAPPALGMDASGAHITSEQISRSVVLDLAELNDSAASGLERFFAGSDIQSIINYLWIAVAATLIILSIIFVVFSCYFYRKFRTWKICNKDIRSQLNHEMYPGDSLMPCNELRTENAYYQMQSPPCYTIATGLPSYDEALQHHQHFSFGMKFVYPSIAAVHHHPAISGMTSSWEKADLTLKRKEQKSHKVATLELEPPTYVDAASVALLSGVSSSSSSPNVKSEEVAICMGEEQEETAVGAQTATTASTDDSDAAFVVVVA